MSGIIKSAVGAVIQMGHDWERKRRIKKQILNLLQMINPGENIPFDEPDDVTAVALKEFVQEHSEQFALIPMGKSVTLIRKKTLYGSIDEAVISHMQAKGGILMADDLQFIGAKFPDYSAPKEGPLTRGPGSESYDDYQRSMSPDAREAYRQQFQVNWEKEQALKNAVKAEELKTSVLDSTVSSEPAASSKTAFETGTIVSYPSPPEK